MTWGLLKEAMKDIPNDATIMSDSGWECDPTDTDGVWYDDENNIVYLTQGDTIYNDEYDYDDYGYRGRYMQKRNYFCVYTQKRPHGWKKEDVPPCWDCKNTLQSCSSKCRAFKDEVTECTTHT